MASGLCGFVGRQSSRDDPTHVKEGCLMTLLQGTFHVNRSLSYEVGQSLTYIMHVMSPLIEITQNVKVKNKPVSPNPLAGKIMPLSLKLKLLKVQGF